MGLFRLIARLFGLGTDSPTTSSDASTASTGSGFGDPATPTIRRRKPAGLREGKPLKRPLGRLRYQSSLVRTPSAVEVVETPVAPYAYARFGPFRDTFLNLAQDVDRDWLNEFKLPRLATPDDLANWLEVPLGELAWLAGRFDDHGRPDSVAKWHYVPRWVPKRSGDHRLIESPKPKLKSVQQKILRGILDQIPAHRAAHGFVKGKSAVSNADAHVGSGVLFKIDLENFYGNIGLGRVVAIFRTVGFSRDVAMWLAYLTTSLPPYDLRAPDRIVTYGSAWSRRHLPQGAPTSPAIANLSAYGLDVRLHGLAKKYKAKYTRYADDLTFSGPRGFAAALRQFIPLSESIISSERFVVNKAKRRVLRPNQRMTVTGIVVNEHVNMSRREYDQLKATIHNCLRHGPASQNRQNHPDFEAHLRGRIEYLRQLNPERGERLLGKFNEIRWA